MFYRNISIISILSVLVLLLWGGVNSSFAAPACTDNDFDGYGAESTNLKNCPGSTTEADCDDTDPNVNPGEAEVCDGKDTNCDGTRPFNDYDVDEDGFAVCNGDCNDLDAAVNPDALEICGDGIDNNCNNATDEAGCVCPDADGDGHPAAFCGGDDCDDTDPTIFENCPGCTDADGDGFSVEGGNCGPVDCDDTDPTVNPGAEEVCDGKDTDCDGDRSFNDYDVDEDGFAVCNGDCNDLDAAVNPDALEICGDGIDNNCNNATDEAGCICPDADGDGHPAAFCGGDDCDDTDPTIFENCPGCTDADGDGFSVEGGNCGPVDCDDTDPTVNPGADEVCDGKDTDCDGSQPWNDFDLDGDGYALCNGECDDRPDGEDGIPGTPDDGANINPGMLERTIRDAICSDGLDNDCDNNIDNVDTGCFPPTCQTKSSPKQAPHFFTLLNPDDTVHPDNNSLLCGKCHGAGLTDPIRGECQRCHADSSDPSDPLNGTTKDQYPLDPPYGYGSAPNVKMHSSETVGNKYGNWTMGAQGCSVCHNPHAQEQNNIFGSDYGMYIKEYICYDNDDTGQRVEEFVELTSPTGLGSFADGPPHIENVCEMCHTRTNHHQRDGDAPGGQEHFTGEQCTSCHLHEDGFLPTGGEATSPHNTDFFNANCQLCHVETNGVLDLGVPIPDENCQRCHGWRDTHTSDPSRNEFGSNYTYDTKCIDCHNPMFEVGGNRKLIRPVIDFTRGDGTNVNMSTIANTTIRGTGSLGDGAPHDGNICESCHSLTGHNNYLAGGNHDDGMDRSGSYCMICHDHNKSFMEPGRTCVEENVAGINCGQ